MTRAELELLTRHVELTEELIAAKDAYRADRSDKNKERMVAAKQAVTELTSYWRGIRACMQEGAAGVAAPATVKAKVK